MSDNVVDFTKYVSDIEAKAILLPDFQREFVWRDEDMQKKLVASVLARMPIGSVLMLKSQKDDYSSKLIGCNTKVDTSTIGDNVRFLLDGQQRMTVLTNVFSNVIHEQYTKVSELVSPTLKKRFFLKIPKWTPELKGSYDIFGVYDLRFPYQEPNTTYPDFLSGDVYDQIECISFTDKNRDNEPFNPKTKLSTNLDTFCITQKDSYLVPLYLLIPTKTYRPQMKVRYNNTIDLIADQIQKSIFNDYLEKVAAGKKEDFINNFFDITEIEDIENRDEAQYEHEAVEDKLKDRKMSWARDLQTYLQACIERIILNEVVVEENQRERAIDIYENMNRGGVSLNTFDLIMARVAKVSTDNFFTRMIKFMDKKKDYPRSVLPAEIDAVLGDQIDAKKYNACLETRCYNTLKNEVNTNFISVFLNVLSMYCHNPSFSQAEFKLDYIKQGKILSLTPSEINDNAEKIWTAVDRGLFFLQTRCGIRSIQELNYRLFLMLVSTVFIKDEYFERKDIHDKLEALYWASIFSGEYDRNQNDVILRHLKRFFNSLDGSEDFSWIASLKDGVLEAQNFSDEKLLLMEKAGDDRIPKVVLRNFICQYLLSQTYDDMFESGKIISVFCKEGDSLEAHHIIPLGSVKKIGESTKGLRDNNAHICNSPLNFVYITSQANSIISDKSLTDYINDVRDEARSELHLNGYHSVTDADTDEKIKALLHTRYCDLKGDIKKEISKLLA